MSFAREIPEGVVLKVVVQPRSSKTTLDGIHGGFLKIRVNAPPVEGKANEECIRFFSKMFDTSKNKIRILKGQKSRNKQVMLYGLRLGKVKEILKRYGISED